MKRTNIFNFREKIIKNLKNHQAFFIADFKNKHQALNHLG